MLNFHLNPNFCDILNAPNVPTTTGITVAFFMPCIYKLIVMHFTFLDISFFPFVHPYIYDLNLVLGFINNTSIWSSSFVKTESHFVLSNSICLMLLLLWCSFKTMFSHTCIHCYALFIFLLG